MVGFEIKRTERPSTTKSMHSALADLTLDRLVVVHAGEHRFALADRITAIGAADLLVAADPSQTSELIHYHNPPDPAILKPPESPTPPTARPPAAGAPSWRPFDALLHARNPTASRPGPENPRLSLPTSRQPNGGTPEHTLTLGRLRPHYQTTSTASPT